MALYLSLLQELIACLTIPCLSYCISLAIKPFLYSTNMLTVLFHSCNTLSDCILFKDTTNIVYKIFRIISPKIQKMIFFFIGSANWILSKYSVHRNKLHVTISAIFDSYLQLDLFGCYVDVVSFYFVPLLNFWMVHISSCCFVVLQKLCEYFCICLILTLVSDILVHLWSFITCSSKQFSLNHIWLSITDLYIY